jgi:sugar phosphate isomerase/epimerase
MKLSCSSPMVPGETLTDKAFALNDWGYDAISVFWPLSHWNDSVLEELMSLQDRTGVRPCEFVFMDEKYGRLMDRDPQTRAECRLMYREAAEVCAQLGMVSELEYEYGSQNPMPLFDPYQQVATDQMVEFADMYRVIADANIGTDALVLLEPLNRYESRYLNSVKDCLYALDVVDHPNTGLLFDFFHVSIEEADIVDAIKRSGSRIKHVHLADNNRLLPGHGNIDWERSLATLGETGFDGYLNLECSTTGDPSETLPSTAQYLRALIS